MAEDREEVRAELEALARHVGASVRARNHHHPAVADPFTHVVRFDRAGHPIAWSAGASHFLIEVERPSGVVFAAGKPDLVVGAGRSAGDAGRVAVFEAASGGGEPLAAWLAAHGGALSGLELRGEEQLLVAANRTTLITEPRGLEPDLVRLDALCAVVDLLPAAGAAKPLTDAALPAELESLQPLLAHWAIDDDEQRALAIERASDRELAQLWQAVGPKLDAIDHVLQHEDGRIAGLDSLAQAALEAERELRRRTAS
jgi:hypothetical protein